MKQLYFFLTTLLCAVAVNAQTVFTEALATGGTVNLLIIDDELYAGSWNAGRLAKVPLSDPNTVTLVTDDYNAGAGPWKTVYDPIRNDIYVGSLGQGLSRLDLDDPLPVASEFLTNFGIVDGMVIHNDILYVAGTQNGVMGTLYSLDLSAGGTNFELEFSSPTESIRSPLFYNNEFYYASKELSTDPTEIYKVDIFDSNPTPELIATMPDGTVQSSLLAGNYAYFGLEGNNHRITRIDLNQQNYPIPEQIILENLDGGVIAFARDGNRLFFNNNFDYIMVYEDPNLSVSENAIADLQIFPNPTNDLLFVKGNVSEGIEFSIYSVNGKILMNEAYSSEGIDTQSLSKGIYFLTITSEESIVTQKFIKN